MLVIADLGMLRARSDEATPVNLQLCVNVAEYTNSR